MKTKFLTLSLGLATLVSIGCDSTSNTNVNLKNVNMSNNTATVVNNNSNAMNTNANMNGNRMMNGNVNRADYDKNRAEYERDRGDSKIGTGANDSWLWFKTKGALALLVDDLRDSTINVDVDNAVVTLRGTVANAAQKTKAEQAAKGIEGVTSVKNELKIAANDSVTNVNVNSVVNGNGKTNANTTKGN